MTISNLFGILVVLLLIGYGLINIPRDIWIYSNHKKEIEYCQYRAFELFAESEKLHEMDINEPDFLSKTETLLEDYANVYLILIEENF